MLKSNTCLAVLKYNNKLYFAGDRRASWHWGKAQITPRPKVSYRDGILLAGTGHSFLCTEFVHIFPIPKITLTNTPDAYYPEEQLPEYKDIQNYIYTNFIDEVCEHLKKKGLLDKDRRALFKSEKDDDISAVILVGIKTYLFELDLSSDVICIDEINIPYAHGCGGSLALGSLLTTESSMKTPEDRLKIALRVAAQVSPGCNDEIDIIHN